MIDNIINESNEANKPKQMLRSRKSIVMPLLLNKNAIELALLNGKEFEDKGIIIRKWEGVDKYDYLTNLYYDNMKYFGIVNKKFERNTHGFLYYKNGDQYLGHYKNNKRHSNGIYYWAPKEIGENLYERDMYIGNWENDEKKGNGLYLWLREKINRNDFNSADMDVYIGIIENHQMIKGTHMLKQDSNYFVYHGAFDSEGNKEDNNAYYYISNSEMLIRGHISNNHFINGYLAHFGEEGQITHLAFCTFNKDGTIKRVKDQSKSDQSPMKEIRKDLELFRAIILEKDYFKNIYDKHKDTEDFIATNMHSFDIFDDEKKFPLLVKAYTDYHDCNIFRDIETKMF